MAALFDEHSFPYPDSLSPKCRKGVELLIQNGRVTYGWLARPSANGQGLDFFIHEDDIVPKGHAEYAVFDNA